jgi:hypothetical protein
LKLRTDDGGARSSLKATLINLFGFYPEFGSKLNQMTYRRLSAHGEVESR